MLNPHDISDSARAAREALLLSLYIDPEAAEPTQTQIYMQLRSRILGGDVRPGDLLPSTRRLATELGCSRTPVLSAYDQLTSEGFIEAQPRSSARVSDAVAGLPIKRSTNSPDTQAELSARGTRMNDWVDTRFSRRMQDMPGHTDPGSFPFETWARLQHRIWRDPTRDILWCHDAAGYPPLRQALAQHLRVTRLLSCEPEQIVITTGIKQNADLVGRLMLDIGDKAIVEDPGFPSWFVLDALGVEMVPVPVDDHGLDIAAGEGAAPDAKLAIVTPSHQFPLGSTMPLQRRLELLRWAERRGTWILEDDYDSEFKYSGVPVAALQGLDGGDRVIYAGTFSKSLFPTLRMSFLVLPPGIVERFVRARRAVDNYPSILPQPVMAAFIAEGHLAAHVRTMRQIYRQRHDALLAAVDSFARELFAPVNTETGLTITFRTSDWLAGAMSDVKLAALAVEAGLHATPLSGYCLKRKPLHGLMVGLGLDNEREIAAGVEKLARAIEKEGALR